MSEAFEREPAIVTYFKWHYGQGLKELAYVAQNFLWFIVNFFSFKLFLKTLFNPWKRMGESYRGGFDLGELASTFIVNALMRAVGFAIRLIVLVVGAVTLFLALVFSLCISVIWLFAPAVLLGSLILSAIFFIV